MLKKLINFILIGVLSFFSVFAFAAKTPDSVPVYRVYLKSGSPILDPQDSPTRVLIDKKIEEELRQQGVTITNKMDVDADGFKKAILEKFNESGVYAAVVLVTRITGDVKKEVTMMFQGKARLDLSIDSFQFENGLLKPTNTFSVKPQIMPLQKWSGSEQRINKNLEQITLKLLNTMEKGKDKTKLSNFFTAVGDLRKKMDLSWGDDLPALLKKAPKAKEDPSRWLLAIGVEKYDETDNIAYSERSTRQFVKVAQTVLGVSERNTYDLINSAASSGKIKDKVKKMLGNMKEGDTLFFYYSGHGIPVLPDNEPYLLPADRDPDMIKSDPDFQLKRFYKKLSDSSAGRVIVFVDSCFSGATDNKTVFKGVAAGRLASKKVSINKEKMVIITAAQGKQFSNMFEKRKHRLFSYYLMKSLIEGKKDILDIYKDVRANVRDQSIYMGDANKQEPTLEGNDGIKL